MANTLNEAVRTAKQDLRVIMGKHLQPDELDRLVRVLNRIGRLKRSTRLKRRN